MSIAGKPFYAERNKMREIGEIMQDFDVFEQELEYAMDNYVKTGVFVCPLEDACSVCRKACENCQLLKVVDILGLLKQRLRGELLRALSYIEEEE